MPTSGTGRRKSSNLHAFRRARQRGVTLVELLVVLAIIAMIASVVVLNAPPPVSDVERASEKLAARIDFAATEAITAGVTIGLETSEAGYRFLKFDRGEWREMTGPRFRPHAFPADFAVEFDVKEAAKKNEPEEKRTEKDEEKRPDPAIRFSPTGETTPFAATFKERRGTAIVSLNAVGEVTVSTGDDDR